MLKAISPIDGRYASKTASLQDYFSEAALMKYRIHVELAYYNHLCKMNIIDAEGVDIDSFLSTLDMSSYERVKSIEKVTNHDVKAIEYFLKESLVGTIDDNHLEFIHFGLTSQDINNTAMPMMVRDAINEVIITDLDNCLELLAGLSEDYKDIPLLAHTHGQPASPTTLGKEMKVFEYRMGIQLEKLKEFEHTAKFGGATGNFNAHKVSYPSHDWPNEINQMIASLGLKRQVYTTQIDNYDGLAELFQILIRINTIYIDFARDIWAYISMNYFRQKVVANEVGSSAMPHKVNPIDFENAEGNLGLANALLGYLAEKLPVSRLQRDLTDSTVTRNIGVPFGHIMVAMQSLQKGIKKLEVNKEKIEKDLLDNWAVVAEAIQTVLKREGFEKPYELLKAFSRGKGKLSKEDFDQFINDLDASDELKSELRGITPYNYIGYA
jgi:adenylosuccinate lyase